LPFPEVLSSLQAPRLGARTRTVVLGGREEVTVVRALIQVMSNPACATELVAVASMDAGSTMLAHASGAGIAASVLGNGDFATHGHANTGQGAGGAAKFCKELQQVMVDSCAQQLVILSDVDTTLLTKEFLEAWVGNVLLVHDSLLPSFPGPQPLEAAIQAGVCITGCTVCFALPAVAGSTVAGASYGPIIVQQPTCVLPGDSVQSLHDRVVSECECKVLATAMQLVAEGSVALNRQGKYRLERTSSFIQTSIDDMACD